MDLYFIVKTLHILSSTILFGTGIGIAFFMFRSRFSNNIVEKAYAARNTALADYCFTFPAVIIQPLSGALLIYLAGYDWRSFWLITSFAIYIIAGLCWLPVVWIQHRLFAMCKKSAEERAILPPEYHLLFKLWFILGWPAFLGLIVIFYLMVAKPT